MTAPVVTLKLPYVYSIPDRHGNDRLYFWRGMGHPRIRLREALGTAAFNERYDVLMGRRAAPDRIARPQERTLYWLCAAYRDSTEFRRLQPSTRSDRRLILESACREPTAPGEKELFADFPLHRFTSKAVRVLRDRKADLPSVANKRVKMLRYVFKWGMEAEYVSSNPASVVGLIRTSTEGHHAWTMEELEQFELQHPIGTKARLALDLFMYTGARRSDVVRFGRQHVRQGWLRFTQFKTKTAVELPILPALQRTIDASPTGHLTFLVTGQGKPFTAAGFGNRFREWCNEAGLPQCSAHGLRKAAAVRAAENGATTHQLMAMFGWLNLSEADRYTKAAQRKKLAGAALVLLKRPEAKEGT
jgi:integrase